MPERPRGVTQFIAVDKDRQPIRVLPTEEVNRGTGPQPVLCARCADGPPVVPSGRDVCARCGAAVWVSRETHAGLALLRQPELWCLACLEAHLGREGS